MASSLRIFQISYESCAVKIWLTQYIDHCAVLLNSAKYTYVNQSLLKP